MRKLSREQWIGGAFDALCDGGIESLRVEPLAKQLSVTKGSFYHHFANRRALHLAMLSAWEDLGTAQIIDEVETASAPDEQLRLLIRRTFAVDQKSDAIETSIRTWAATDSVVAEAVKRVDDRRVDFVTTLLTRTGLTRADARRRSLLMYRVLIGEFIWRTAGGPASKPGELDELAEILLRPT